MAPPSEASKCSVHARHWNGVYRALSQPDLSLATLSHDAEQFRRRQDVAGLWPDRLLHIDSMMSFPRTDDLKYNKVHKPSFTILSSKWGLWVKEGASALPIKGIQWDMPSIDPNYFTVVEMTQVLWKMRKHAEFVWIDVACIDQFLTESTLREIIVEPRYSEWLHRVSFGGWI